MRKFNIFSLIVFVALSISSCSDYLDIVPDNFATIEYAFRDKVTAERVLFTCYSYLPSHGELGSNPGLAAGDEFAPNNTTVRTMTETGNNASNPLFNYWDGSRRLFLGIRYCNMLMENVDQIPDISEWEAKRWKAEARFLKAYYHWWLFQLYGPIPIIDVSLGIDASTEEVRVFREPVDEVVNYIVTQIDAAVVDLPASVAGVELTELGRITSTAALAIKARVLTTAASPMFNGNNNYANFVDSRGVKLFNTDYDATKWDRALKACQEAIEACHAQGLGLYHFVPPAGLVLNDSMQKVVQPAMILGDINNNKELIWVQSNTTSSNAQRLTIPTKMFYGQATGNTFVSPNEVYGNNAPSLNIAELYYSNHGVPINEDKTYPQQDMYKPISVPVDHKYWVKVGYTTAGFNLHREPRYYGSIAFDGSNWYGFGRTNQDDQFFVKAKKNDMGGRFSPSGMYIKKYVPYLTSLAQGNSGSTVGITYSPYHFPIMRMTDLYLLFAECLNEVEGPVKEVVDVVDDIRHRAGLEGVVESWTNYSIYPTEFESKEGMRNIIQRERMIELAFEGNGFFDKRRWKLLDQYMGSGSIRGWNVTSDEATEYFKSTILWTTNFKFRDYLWPIKVSNITQNPNLVQNPGW